MREHHRLPAKQTVGSDVDQPGAAALGLPFFIAAALKIVYDVTIYFTFRNVHPPEERARQEARRVAAAAKTTTT